VEPGGSTRPDLLGASETKSDSTGDRARYDRFCDWYLTWIDGWSPGLVFDPTTGLVPAQLSGERWLDVGCGSGRASRELARRGASTIGVDIAASLIAEARAAEDNQHPNVTYVAGDITRPEQWWDGQLFDGATCELALMDIDDLDGTADTIARVLRPDGRFVASIVNPCFPGNEAGLSSWPPDRGYSAEGFWTSPEHNPDGARIRVGSNHRTLSTYLNTLISAGFSLERAFEPSNPLPYWLVLVCRRN